MRIFNKVVCLRITKETFNKLKELHKNYVDMSLSELARECLIRGIARMESEKPNDGK